MSKLRHISTQKLQLVNSLLLLRMNPLRKNQQLLRKNLRFLQQQQQLKRLQVSKLFRHFKICTKLNRTSDRLRDQ